MRGLALYGALVLDWRKMTALEQPVQEPVAWTWDAKNQRDGFLDAHFQFSKPESHSLIMNLRPLYTCPPKREWVGLIDTELVSAYMSVGDKEWAIAGMEDATKFAKAIEAKLQQLNQCNGSANGCSHKRA